MLAVGVDGRCLDIFLSPVIPLYLSLSLSLMTGPTARYILSWLVSWLIWFKRPFETVIQSISGRLPERRRKQREMIGKRKMSS